MKKPLRVCLLAATALGIAFAAATSAIVRPARATEEFTKETGKPCGACHEAPKGGGKLTPYGERFRANGNKVPPVSGHLDGSGVARE